MRPNESNNEIAIIPPDAVPARQEAAVIAPYMPAMTIESAHERWETIRAFVSRIMVPNEDYGAIPGTGGKPCLLKPGAEKLIAFFGLAPSFEVVQRIEQWDAKEPFFFYEVRCKLVRDGIVRGEGLGSCNSRESKYRWRQAERNCPKCGAAAIIRGKPEYGGGHLCYSKKGGCGAKFPDGDKAIEGQQTGRVPNESIADSVNVLLKMAKKRSLIDATLNTIAASQFFEQDREDLEAIDVPAAQPQPPRSMPPAEVDLEAKPQPDPEAPARPWRNFGGMIDEFAKLHGRLGSDYDHLYRETLKEYGVEHSNQFKNTGQAVACYNRLLKHVLKIEAAARDGTAHVETPAAAGNPPEQLDPEDELAAATSQHRTEMFARMRQALGDAAYYEILGAHGFEHATDVKSLSTSRTIYQEMGMALEYQTGQEAV